MADACTFCGADVAAHDPIRVTDYDSGETLGLFCNYACLVTHVDAENLTENDACQWTPEGENCC